MPIFDFKCPQCDHIEEKIVDNNTDHIKCPMCIYAEMSKIPSVFGINVGVGAYGYYDDTLQTYVHTNEHKRQVMKDQGVSEYNKINDRVSDRGKWV